MSTEDLEPVERMERSFQALTNARTLGCDASYIMLRYGFEETDSLAIDALKGHVAACPACRELYPGFKID